MHQRQKCPMPAGSLPPGGQGVWGRGMSHRDPWRRVPPTVRRAEKAGRRFQGAGVGGGGGVGGRRGPGEEGSRGGTGRGPRWWRANAGGRRGPRCCRRGAHQGPALPSPPRCPPRSSVHVGSEDLRLLPSGQGSPTRVFPTPHTPPPPKETISPAWRQRGCHGDSGGWHSWGGCYGVWGAGAGGAVRPPARTRSPAQRKGTSPAPTRRSPAVGSPGARSISRGTSGHTRLAPGTDRGLPRVGGSVRRRRQLQETDGGLPCPLLFGGEGLLLNLG